MDNHGIVSIVRALSERVDPGQVLRDVVRGAVAATESGHGVVAGAVDGEVTPLVVAGSLTPVLLEAAARSVASGSAAHASDPHAGLDAWAVPVRLGPDVTAALAVAGPPRPFDPSVLTPWADCVALAMSGPGPATHAPPARAAVDFAEQLATVLAETTPRGVLRRALEVAGTLFAARSGLACLLEGSSAEIAYYVGLRRDRLAEATRHPAFSELVSTSVTKVRPPTDGVVARLSEGAEFAVCLPLPAFAPSNGGTGGPPAGSVILLVGDAPGADVSRSLEAYRDQVAAALRAALLGADLDQAGSDLAGVVHAMPEPVLAVDDAGRFLGFNAAAAELFALAEPFEVGRPARGRLGHPELEALLLGERAADLEVALGRPSPTRWLAYTRRVGRGRVLVLREVSRARRGDRSEADFVASVGRELREPLEAIRKQLASATAPLSLVQAIDDEMRHLEALADQLTFLGDAERMVLRPEQHDVVALVRDLAGEAERGAPGRTVTVVAQPGRLEARVDRRALDRALRPLLDNALRYSDGPVGVEVADKGEAFEVAVIDAGPGIFSGDVPGLFERFHPLDGSPTRKGAGLGLYTARRMVEAMDGRIWCDSRLGVGSRFAFRLKY